MTHPPRWWQLAQWPSVTAKELGPSRPAGRLIHRQEAMSNLARTPKEQPT
jgi:hypothetical protein